MDRGKVQPQGCCSTMTSLLGLGMMGRALMVVKGATVGRCWGIGCRDPS
jgi:hypothetical protein